MLFLLSSKRINVLVDYLQKFLAMSVCVSIFASNHNIKTFLIINLQRSKSERQQLKQQSSSVRHNNIRQQHSKILKNKINLLGLLKFLQQIIIIFITTKAQTIIKKQKQKQKLNTYCGSLNDDAQPYCYCALTYEKAYK